MGTFIPWLFFKVGHPVQVPHSGDISSGNMHGKNAALDLAAPQRAIMDLLLERLVENRVPESRAHLR